MTLSQASSLAVKRVQELLNNNVHYTDFKEHCIMISLDSTHWNELKQSILNSIIADNKCLPSKFSLPTVITLHTVIFVEIKNKSLICKLKNNESF